MKKLYFVFIMLSIALMPVITACNNDEPSDPDDNVSSREDDNQSDSEGHDGLIIWDFAGTSAYVYVKSSKGVDLLNPAEPNNVLSEGITFTYDGKTSDLVCPNASSRFLLPTWYGAKLTVDTDGKYRIMVGEWLTEQTATYKFSLKICGKSHNCTLDHKIEWKNNQPKVTNKFAIDKNKFDGCIGVIVL